MVALDLDDTPSLTLPAGRHRIEVLAAGDRRYEAEALVPPAGEIAVPLR